MQNPREILLSDIDAFLSRSGMAPSVFSELATGDRSFVRQLRNGREPNFALSQRVLEFIRTHDAAANEESAA
jgi:hypothetical protein